MTHRDAERLNFVKTIAVAQVYSLRYATDYSACGSEIFHEWADVARSRCK